MFIEEERGGLFRERVENSPWALYIAGATRTGLVKESESLKIGE